MRICRRAGSNDDIFWTGTVNGDNTDNSWIVNDNGGNVNNGNNHQSNDNRVACVP